METFFNILGTIDNILLIPIFGGIAVVLIGFALMKKDKEFKPHPGKLEVIANVCINQIADVLNVIYKSKKSK